MATSYDQRLAAAIRCPTALLVSLIEQTLRASQDHGPIGVVDYRWIQSRPDEQVVEVQDEFDNLVEIRVRHVRRI